MFLNSESPISFDGNTYKSLIVVFLSVNSCAGIVLISSQLLINHSFCTCLSVKSPLLSLCQGQVKYSFIENLLMYMLNLLILSVLCPTCQYYPLRFLLIKPIHCRVLKVFLTIEQTWSTTCPARRRSGFNKRPAFSC